jgi:hypothetical protein
MKNSLNTSRDNFTASCLPNTMRLADKYRNIIEPFLESKNLKWTFHDNVYAWLSPSSYKDVFDYYTGENDCLIDKFVSMQLDKLDELAFSKLGAKIRAVKAAKSRKEHAKRNLTIEGVLGIAVVHRNKKI